MTDLLALGADVEWTDADASAAARDQSGTGSGRLAELVEWLAGTQGRFPPTLPKRVRCIVVGLLSPAAAATAESLGVGIRTLDVPTDPNDALALGIAAADDEVEAGADLFVLAAADPTAASAVIVGSLTGAEPVALLPRGAEATDTAQWIERAEFLRDTRRQVATVRHAPQDLLVAAGSPVLAAATGFLLRAVVRRTAVVLDGSAAVAAALLSHDTQSRAGRWWRIADTSPDPVHTRAAAELSQRPLLDLGTRRGDGTSGLLAVEILRAAIRSLGHQT